MLLQDTKRYHTICGSQHGDPLQVYNRELENDAEDFMLSGGSSSSALP